MYVCRFTGLVLAIVADCSVLLGMKLCTRDGFSVFFVLEWSANTLWKAIELGA